MARKGGLGPQGIRAVKSAAETQELIRKGRAPKISEQQSLFGNRANPSKTSTESDDEVTNCPAEDEFYTFDSSRVSDAAYDEEHQRLYVRFVKPQPVGTPWTYEGVPLTVWHEMLQTSSKGKFVNRVLNNFNYHRGRLE